MLFAASCTCAIVHSSFYEIKRTFFTKRGLLRNGESEFKSTNVNYSFRKTYYTRKTMLYTKSSIKMLNRVVGKNNKLVTFNN